MFSKLFYAFIEVLYWILIFLSPVFVSLLVGLILVTTFNLNVGYLYGLLVGGGVCGIVLAEKIRRKYGCSEYWSKIFATPELIKRIKQMMI